MADVKPNMNIRVGKTPQSDDGSLVLVTWNGINNANNTGSAVQIPMHSDRTIQFNGTFNTALAWLEGSNDGVTWEILTNPAGSALTFSAKGLKQVVEAPLYVRPNANNTKADTNLVATLLMRRNAPLTR